LGILVFIFSKNISGRLKSFGSIFLFVGLPFFIIKELRVTIIDLIIKNLEFPSRIDKIVNVINVIVDRTFAPIEIYYKLLVLSGVILLGIGYFVEYYLEKRKK
ncbi:MAG: hypothetical protein J7L39_03140, partial [Candidatus Aenigmarchaeota archaeon]|nr:hypothetical protein [Candidatus Aenigmarchaeota archaeon]